jgi:hypothetical protein
MHQGQTQEGERERERLLVVVEHSHSAMSLLSLSAAASFSAAPSLPRRRVAPFHAMAAPPALERRRRPQNVPGEFFVGEQAASLLCAVLRGTSKSYLLCSLQTTGASTARPADGWHRYPSGLLFLNA